MSKIVLQYSIVNDTGADAVPVEANFNRIESHINQEVIERAGSVGMTGQLKLAGDPVAVDDAASKGYVDSLFPIGFINMFGGSTPPPGGVWLICDGAELDTASYSALFAVIGTAYGSASAGRFNLPDMRGRFPVGAGTSDALGSAGGSRHAIIPAHDHGIDHTHARTATYGASVDHAHGDDHYHTGNTGAMDRDANHSHTSSEPGVNFVGVAGPESGLGQSASGGNTLHSFGTTSVVNIDHLHPIVSNYKSQQGFNTQTGGQSVDHTHNVDVATYNGNSAIANGAAGTNVDANLPPYRAVNYLIKAR